MVKDYCEYILELDSARDCTSYMSLGRVYNKKELLNEVKMAIKLRKQATGIKLGFDPDCFLFEIAENFFMNDKVLLGYNTSKILESTLTQNRNKLMNVKEKWENGDYAYYEGMYEELFEIITSYMVIMENARISVREEKQTIVDFHTSDIEIDKLVELVVEESKNSQTEEKKGRIVISKDLLKNIKKNKEQRIVDVETALFYFSFILYATHTRNEELKAGVGYGW